MDAIEEVAYSISVNRRWKIVAGISGMFLLLTVFILRPTAAQKAAEETRRTLRRQGYRLEFEEFALATSAELQARAKTLTEAGRLCSDLFDTDDSGSAIKPASGRSRAPHAEPGEHNEWFGPLFGARLSEHRAALDSACLAAISGPLRLQLVPQTDGTLPVSDLGCLSSLASALAARTALELRGGFPPKAWTNLLALTCLVADWSPDQREISHLVRFSHSRLAQAATGDALRLDGWVDGQLAALQNEWQHAEFFGGLAETAALSRVNGIMACRFERGQPLDGSSALEQGPGLFTYPKSLCADLLAYAGQWQYHRFGTHEDEKAVMLYFQARESEFQQAALCTAWSEMRLLPGATNFVSFHSTTHSRIEQLISLKLGSLGLGRPNQGMLARAADAEARRRLAVTAIALARYRGAHGIYPQTLAELVPALLDHEPLDFMDGKPLRYHRTPDGQFLLYSVGLDCVDHGGVPGPRILGEEPGTDLVWPCVAKPGKADSTLAAGGF